jgi:hypothetical protein
VTSEVRTRGWSMRTRVAVILAAIATSVAAYAVAVALFIRPPSLGWAGFSIVAIILLGLGALAPLGFERTRVSPQRPASAHDRRRRLLVVADSQCTQTALCDAIVARLRGPTAVHLVVPVRVSHLHFLTDDEAEERRESERMLSASVALLRQRGLSASGSVGSDKPLESMTDALGAFPATSVLLATPPQDHSYWLERGLLAKARALTTVPVAQVVVRTVPLPASTHAGRSLRTAS